MSNLEKAVHLFTRYLGFQTIARHHKVGGHYLSSLVGIEKAEISVAIVRMPDNQRLELIEYLSNKDEKNQEIRSSAIGFNHIALSVTSIDALYETRAAFDIRFVSPPLKSPDGYVKVAYVIFMEEFIVEMVEVLDPRAEYSGGA